MAELAEVSDAEVAKRALQFVDLTDLNDDCTPAAIETLCQRAETSAGHVAAVCVWPRFVAQAKSLLAGSMVKVATVVNFPAGGEDTAAVIAETEQALRDGADEIDLVLAYKAFASGRKGFAEEQIIRVRQVVPSSAHLKVILETGELKDAELIREASEIAIKAGADFIKTSTGKVPVNATLEAAGIMLNVIRMEEVRGGRPVGLKPSGGIRTFEDAKAYLELADRIMGPDWATPESFRFGASGLLDALLAKVSGQTAPAGSGY